MDVVDERNKVTNKKKSDENIQVSSETSANIKTDASETDQKSEAVKPVKAKAKAVKANPTPVVEPKPQPKILTAKDVPLDLYNKFVRFSENPNHGMHEMICPGRNYSGTYSYQQYKIPVPTLSIIEDPLDQGDFDRLKQFGIYNLPVFPVQGLAPSLKKSMLPLYLERVMYIAAMKPSKLIMMPESEFSDLLFHGVEQYTPPKRGRSSYLITCFTPFVNGGTRTIKIMVYNKETMSGASYFNTDNPCNLLGRLSKDYYGVARHNTRHIRQSDFLTKFSKDKKDILGHMKKYLGVK